MILMHYLIKQLETIFLQPEESEFIFSSSSWCDFILNSLRNFAWYSMMNTLDCTTADIHIFVAEVKRVAVSRVEK